MEELETLESTECPECPGPPPEFRLPPPPRPPFLTDGTFCSEEPLTEIEDCVAIPVSSDSSIVSLSLFSTAKFSPIEKGDYSRVSLIHDARNVYVRIHNFLV